MPPGAINQDPPIYVHPASSPLPYHLMQKSKSMSNALVASLGGLPKHPALGNPDQLLQFRMGSEEPFRLPDSYNVPTAATVLRSEYTLSSDAAGELLFAESNSLAAARLAWTVTAGLAGSTPAQAAHPQSTAFYAEARAARCCAIKIQVMYIGANLESAGYLSFVEKYNVLDVNAQAVDSIHTGSVKQVPAAEGLIVHMDFTQEPRFEVPNATGFMQYTFPIAVFAASGLPISKPVFRVRVLRFMEYLPLEGALAEGELAHEPFNPSAMGAHAELSGDGTSTSTVKEYGTTFMQKVRYIANAAYHTVMPMIKPYVMPTALGILRSSYARAGLSMLPMLAA